MLLLLIFLLLTSSLTAMEEERIEIPKEKEEEQTEEIMVIHERPTERTRLVPPLLHKINERSPRSSFSLEKEMLITPRDEKKRKDLKLRRISEVEKPNNPTVLYNATRQFYDDESRKKIRNQEIRKCLCATTKYSILSMIFGSLCFGTPAGYAFHAYGACKNGICIAGKCGVIFDSIMVSNFTLESLVLGLIICTYGEDIKDILKQTDIKWSGKIEFSQDMLDAADEEKEIKTKALYMRRIMDKASEDKFPDETWIQRISAAWHTYRFPKEKEFLDTASERLKTLFDNDPTAKHCFLTEKELLHILQNLHFDNSKPLPGEIKPSIKFFFLTYIYQSELEKRGWISFKKTEKYPIKCNVGFFDLYNLPDFMKQERSGAAHVYGSESGQTMYLPFSEELAKYYKFEKDPAYKEEYENPSNDQIAKLLRLRKDPSQIYTPKQILMHDSLVDEFYTVQLSDNMEEVDF